MPSIFIFNEIRSELLQEVEGDLNNKEKKWFQDNFKEKVIWHLIELSEFEFFLCIPSSERNLFRQIKRYLATSGVDSKLLDSQGRVPASFGDYLIRKFGRKDPKVERRLREPLPELKKVFEDFFADATKYFFGGSANGIGEDV